MKLLRYKKEGKVHLGALVGSGIVQIDGAGYETMLQLVEAGPEGLDRVRAYIAGKNAELALSEAALLAPIERPGKYLAIGMNYAKHVEESERLGVARPEKQYWFNKQTSCLAGPYDTIDPGVTDQLDYEVELGVIIGRNAKGVNVADALSYIFGYVVANDVSAREWQKHSPTFTMGKSFDTHGPIGPWIVTADEIVDPQNLDLRCLVNGKIRQQNNTSGMIFSVAEQISYLSTAFTLEPGDLLATGTPEGVGVAMQPPVFLQEGDIVRCEVEGIGAIENRVERPQ